MNAGIVNEVLYAHAFENAPIGMAILDPDGRFLKVNGAYCDIFGYAAEEILGIHFQSITHGDDLPGCLHIVQQTLEGKLNKFAREQRYYHKKGTIVWTITSISLVRDEPEEPLYFIAQIQDITKRKMTETLLRQNKQRYKSLIEQYPDLVIAVSRDCGILIVNDACEKVTGYTKDEIMQMHCRFPLPNNEQFEKHFHLAAMGQPQEFEGILQHKRGHEVNIRVTFIPIVVEEEVEGVYCIVKDTTEFKQATRQLMNHKELYELISEHAQDLISYSTPDGITQYVSPAIKAILGYEPEEVIGRSTLELWHPDDVVEFSETKILQYTDDDIFICRVRHKDGHYVWFETKVKAIRNPNGGIDKILGIGRDITERKLAEEEKVRAEQLIINSEKLSVAGQLAAGIAHEIRNPLTAIKGFMQLLECQMTDKPHYFEIIASELNRIELIANELLILAKPQAVQYVDQDIRAILEQVITLMEAQAMIKNVHFTTHFDSGELTVRCDENQLKQVFINFVKNAIESMEEGGEITVKASRKSGETEQVDIFIADCGCGIPEEHLAKLGQPFYTTKQKGTGLGLMVSKKIIENHNGSLKVTSEVNVGTQIHIALPIS